MRLCVNLNEEVRFILTDKGLDIWIKYLEALLNSVVTDYNHSLRFDIEQEMKFLYKSHQKSELVSMQLHKFMRVFGEHMTLGSPPPIKDLDVFLELK